MSETKKFEKLGMFFITTFALTYGMGILLYAVYRVGGEVSVFATAQTFYPAMGAIAAMLAAKERERLPMRFFVGFLVVAAAGIGICFGTFLLPDRSWSEYMQFFLITGSVVCWVLLLTEKQEKREVCGLRSRNMRKSIGMVLLFFVLYVLRALISSVIYGDTGSFMEVWTKSVTWIQIIFLPLSFLLVFVAFFGEEYGWRYFLQPILQKRFGLRGGVLLLGGIWGIWHLPLNLFYYSPDTWGLSILAQLITCVSLGIFFAYAYMKTENIWVPVFLHFMNNNLIPVITGIYSADVVQNNIIHIQDVLISLVINGGMFGSFLLSRQFHSSQRQ